LASAKELQGRLEHYAGKLMTPVMLRICAGEVVACLGFREDAGGAIGRLLVRHWLDKRPDRRDILRMALRLNANRDSLRCSDLPPVWVGEPPAWTCAQVVQVVGLPRLAEVTFVGMTGVLAGDALTYRLGAGYVMRLARELGAPRFGDLELRDLLGFFLLARFGQNRHKRQYLLQTAITDSIKKLNRKTYRKRHDETQAQ
jgi:hypothetical protein